MTDTILLAVDGSEHSWKALEVAADLASSRGARVVALHVVPVEIMPEELRTFAQVENLPLEEEYARWHDSRLLGDALTREAETRLKAKGVAAVTTRVAEGPVVTGIIETAGEEAASMIVMGSRGLSDAAGLFLGSISHRVSHLASCTVVVVK
ncbi:universal stress protein [Geminicoccaceae bacterium 1502E]|nr:universal stress protein [Geminicoccaceae bacterium 1502E]